MQEADLRFLFCFAIHMTIELAKYILYTSEAIGLYDQHFYAAITKYI